MDEISFSLILEQLQAILGPIVATIVCTIMGTEIFKRIVAKTNLNISSRTVTWIVWGVVGLVVWLILQWFPLWFIVVLGLVAIGIYSGMLKPVLTRLGLSSSKDGKVPPIGGGGGGPIIKPK